MDIAPNGELIVRVDERVRALNTAIDKYEHLLREGLVITQDEYRTAHEKLIDRIHILERYSDRKTGEAKVWAIVASILCSAAAGIVLHFIK
jgi:hypothetical protein